MVTRLSEWVMLLVLLVPSTSCGPSRPRDGGSAPPQLTFDGLEFRVYRGSALTAFGTARAATFRRDTSDLSGIGIVTRFPGTATRPAAVVEAQRGTGNLRDRRFLAFGGVRGEQSGEIAITEEARYEASDGLIRGDKPIEVGSRRFAVTGPGFTLDPRDQVLAIDGGGTAVAGRGDR